MQGPQRVELEEALKLRAGLRMQRAEVKMDKRDLMMITAMIVTGRKTEEEPRNQL